MDIEKISKLILKFYEKELDYETKYNDQFNATIEKYIDILYGKISRLMGSKENITNTDLYSEDLLVEFSDIFTEVLESLFKELNIENKLFQAMQYINKDLCEVFEIDSIMTDEEIKEDINIENPIDFLTLKQRTSKVQTNMLNDLLKIVVIDASKKKLQVDLTGDLEEKIRSLFYANSRVMATELNRMINQNLIAIYKSAGITTVIFSAIIDSRTSTICSLNNGKIFAISELKVGFNQPPLHVNCRSILLPYS